MSFLAALPALFNAAGSILGATAQRKQAKNALGAWNDAQDTAANTLGSSERNAVANYQPFYDGGTKAFGDAANMLQPGFQYSPSDPSYQWRFDQGMDAATRGAAAGGTLNSGGTMKALTRYGQGMASTEFGNDFNRRNQLADIGFRAANGMSNANMNYGDQMANLLVRTAAGRTGQYGAVGDANTSRIGAVSGGLQGLASFFGVPSGVTPMGAPQTANALMPGEWQMAANPGRLMTPPNVSF
jgi:hypothetical protein